MNAVVFAYHEMGCLGLRALLRHGIDVAAVFTHRDRADENIWFDSVAELATEHGIPVYAPDNVNHPIWEAKIRQLAPDILFSFYYRTILSPAILDSAPRGGLNLHGSLLPAYRGRCPVNWVLINGEQQTGVTLHSMTPRPDDGDIVAQTAVPIDDDDTAHLLFAKMTRAAEGMLDNILPKIVDGTITPVPQDHDRASYFGGRTPADGEIDWSHSARRIRDLVRAVTRPYPGAFTYVGDRKCYVWSASVVPGITGTQPGAVVSVDPLVIACGEDAVRVEAGQTDGGVIVGGPQLALETGVAPGSRFGPRLSRIIEARRTKKVLILGVNGFIGNALSERLLETGRYEVHGLDLHSDKIGRFLNREGFHFHEGDIAIHREWIEYQVRNCDVVIPLVAIATPIEYTRNPLRVFELDFEENLRVVRYCAKYGKRLVFPSTSEVYGMCDDDEFDEDHSRLVLGPIRMQRWIYSCAKQMLDRVIWAYGQQEELRFTLFRPFNWIGPRLDRLNDARIGSSRAITQLILNLVEGSPIRLVDGGEQMRCFTHVDDGIECLLRIIDNEHEQCNGQIFNIGDPDGEASIRHLAEILVRKFEQHPLRANFPPFAGMQEIESSVYYGKGYEDVLHRRPSIRNAQRLLGWKPEKDLEEAVDETLDFFLNEAIRSGAYGVDHDARGPQD